MKNISTLFKLAFVVAAMGAIVSCGADNKTTTEDENGSYSSPVVSTELSRLKTQYRCESGSRFDLTFKTTAAISGGTLYGPFSTGRLSGTTSKTYIGMSGYNDFLVVNKVSGGYNVIMSMCPYGVLLKAGRRYSEFTADGGIYLNSTSTSGRKYGSAEGTDTHLVVEEYTSGSTRYPQDDVYTDFYPVP
ncbi:MAG: hypothetical protein A2504_04295 [Bdellovibrionales bacterium RIFOXYD12_FULL_39_22]|nr:MAG: hypothetical protein A2385_07530 [Bdellovibrionales bacterium RIFOXYB1_FULL_39_21]OFZ42110.1 MAG: hypothetical protein A2485_09500 [Bdellovibrionales bacterium RIFOXYC12_FULL_39_17]OFZ50826.1 MAG: hypothetical protein A2404_06450 [Bdellovibrionales bacterium RIFOXYC1_FULL_39_130]OFZ78049.1 MAG: hypothetical protein A2560_01620 [Bdellovibrionales bacterium RIFOXYD1_FULL_39_84]OFZ93515.1 MAG: hypothetical protein A2504_04295 [Bdellovibrionales bacterium RIFOXYD12_FULL_39_22]HLE10364.1 hy